MARTKKLERECITCGSSFSPYHEASVTCSKVCRRAVDAEEKNRRRRVGEAIDPEARRAINRRNNYRRYGLTPEQVEFKVEAQEGKCAICGFPPSGKGIYAKLHVDHDHHTGQVRNMLCANCNRVLGMMGEDPARLQAAVDYLLRHKEELR
jgi:hypothetical protein